MSPTLTPKQSLWWAILAALSLVGIAWGGLSESLWLDELHTSWCVAGDARQVIARAGAGNQTPCYPWFLQLACWTLGPWDGFEPSVTPSRLTQREWILRLPSLFSTALCVLAGSWYLQRLNHRLKHRFLPIRQHLAGAFISVTLVAWVGWDRIQLFYATEARAYAMLQFLSLLAWLCVIGIANRDASEKGGGLSMTRCMMVWSALTTLSIHLHLIAGLAAGWQAVVISLLLIARKDVEALKRWCACNLSVGVAVLPVLFVAVPVWQRRSQWEAFAGDTSWQTLVELFPLVPLLVPVLTFRIIDQLADWLLPRQGVSAEGSAESVKSLDRWVWLIACLGPWMTAWILTALEVTPLMHRRYVLCSGLPLVLFAMQELLRMRFAALRSICVCVAFAWLVGLGFFSQQFGSQVTAQIWKEGQLIGWQRGEDWRGASRWVGGQIGDSDGLWCASALIEGRQAVPPLDTFTNDYLAFPLSGIYQVPEASGAARVANALVGDTQEWLEQWGRPEEKQRLFIICRSSAGVLKQILDALRTRAAGANMILRTQQGPLPFGSISAAQVELLPSPSSPPAKRAADSLGDQRPSDSELR